MRLQRYTYRRRSRGISLGCGCTALALILGVLTCVGIYALSSTPLLTGLVLDFTGAERIGRTDALFATNPAPRPAITGASSVRQVTLSLGSYGQQPLDTTTPGLTFVTGTASTGEPRAQATFTENGLLQFCNQRGNICTNGDSRYRSISVDLRPGGAVIYADVNAGLWQRVGIVIRLNPAGTRFDVAGVDVGGVLYDPNTLPGEISTFVQEIARVGNDALRQLSVNAAGGRFVLESITIDDTALTLVFR